MPYANSQCITKTCLYNFDPLKPHIYIVKLEFSWVYIIFLISVQKYRLWVHVRTAWSRRFYRVPIIYVLNRNVKNIKSRVKKSVMPLFIFWIIFLLDLELNFIDKLLVFRWELIVLLLLQICFFFVMREIS